MSESKSGRGEAAPIQLRRTASYEDSRAKLTPARLQALEFAEQEIAEDPTHNHWRHPTTDGATVEFFSADEGLIIKFRVASGAVDLEELIDRDEPAGS
jgi:hypothetical protein